MPSSAIAWRLSLPRLKRASGVDLLAGLGCVVIVALPLCACHGIEEVFRLPVAVAFLGIVVAAMCEGCSTPVARLHASDQGEWGVVACNMLHGAVMIAFLQASALEAPAGREQHSIIYLAGFCAIAIGVAIRCWAIGTLGCAFSDGFAPAIRGRISDGPYRVCRHPAECGLILFIAGFATVLEGWCAMTGVLFLAALACSLVRVCLEERAMALAIRP